MKTASFTGHRPKDLKGYQAEDNKELLWRIREVIIDHIENKNVTNFIQGCCIGVDLWSAKIVLKLKETYPHIRLISAIPCKAQFKMWNSYDKDLWEEVVNLSDEVIQVSDLEYAPYLMQKRNEYMVDNSDFLIAVYNGNEKGGTANCVKYAVKNLKEITQIKP